MILVCGDAMTDEYWWGEVSRISPEAPVPVLSVLRKETRHGAAANVALNCEAMGERVEVATINTATKIRLIAKSQQVVRADFDREPLSYELDAMRQHFHTMLPMASTIIFSDYGKGALAEVPRCEDARVLVDPKGWDYSKYRGAYLVKPNLPEMRAWLGGWHTEDQLAEKCAAKMREDRIQNILLTRASGGMTLFTGAGSRTHIPAEVREVYDVTGAGDTAIAALACALEKGFDLEQAVRLANKAAGIVCGKFGTAIATEREVFG